MSRRIDTVAARDKLPIRREPYWHRISRGCYVGFRRMAKDTGGTWMARYRTEGGDQLYASLGTLNEYRPHEQFDQAVVFASKWFDHAGVNRAVRPLTVLEACQAYVEKIAVEKGERSAKELEARYRRWIATDPICSLELMKLTREPMNGFRRRLVAAKVNINKAGATRERSRDTVNRDMAAVRAALNYAYANGQVNTDHAWSMPLKAFQNVTKRRELYLDVEQRRMFIQHARGDIAAFIVGMSLLPLRPGALAALKVGDFDPRLYVLKIGKDKHGRDRKIKLPPQTAAICTESAKDRGASEALFARADGRAWNKDSWKGPIKQAAISAGLPPGATAYSLRHSVITDLVIGGLDLLTVAQISGTSVVMIEKHYGHLRGDVASSALAKLAL